MMFTPRSPTIYGSSVETLGPYFQDYTSFRYFDTFYRQIIKTSIPNEKERFLGIFHLCVCKRLTLICSLKGAAFMYRKKCRKNRQWLLVIDGVVIKLVYAVYLILPRLLAFHLG